MNCLEPEEALAALEGSAAGTAAHGGSAAGTAAHGGSAAGAAGHTAACPACAEVVSEMGRVRILARRIGSECWAPLPQLDVEVALRRVRARAVLVVSTPHRGGASPRVPQVLSAAAAALLLCALVGPYMLRQRVERPAGEEFRPGREGAIFWTSRAEDLAPILGDGGLRPLAQLVGAGVR